MKFNYKDHFNAAPNTGYETLIYDCMIGDPTLFQRADNIEAGWRVVQPVLDAWAEDRHRHATDLSGRAASGPSEPRARARSRDDGTAPGVPIRQWPEQRMTASRPPVLRMSTERWCNRRQGLDRARRSGGARLCATAGSCSRSSAAGRLRGLRSCIEPLA